MIRQNRSLFAQASALRGIASLAVLALLAACASQTPRISSKQEAARYAAHARGNYVPPGPPADPWGPYIREASKRFDVPDLWIRSVMRVESGGNEYQNGQLITSSAGAMGLMQVMPETYDELRDRYSLGGDPFDPHDNILAGTAYLREMYDIYGSPGFLAAYNAGPRRLDDYLSNNRPLPDETRRYVAMIGPNIVGVNPSSRSPAEDYAMNALPIEIPRGTRYGRSVQVASSRGGGGRVPMRGPVEVAQLPEPPRAAAEPLPQQYALAAPPPPPPTWWVPPDPAGRGRADPDASRRVVDRPLGHPGGRLFQREPGSRRTRHRARACTDGAGGCAHLGIRRASGTWAIVSRALDRAVARRRDTGVPTPRAWPHELHGAVAGVAVVAATA